MKKDTPHPVLVASHQPADDAPWWAAGTDFPSPRSMSKILLPQELAEFAARLAESTSSGQDSASVLGRTPPRGSREHRFVAIGLAVAAAAALYLSLAWTWIVGAKLVDLGSASSWLLDENTARMELTREEIARYMRHRRSSLHTKTVPDPYEESCSIGRFPLVRDFTATYTFYTIATFLNAEQPVQHHTNNNYNQKRKIKTNDDYQQETSMEWTRKCVPLFTYRFLKWAHDDQFYCYAVMALGPASYYIGFLNWLGMKFFKHNV